MLKVSDLSKSFNFVSVLRHISFSINKGEVIGLMGNNGVGKSTLLRILSRISSPDSGNIEFEENNLLSSDYLNRRGLFYIGHSPGLYPALSGKENLQFFSSIHKGITDEKMIETTLEKFELDGNASKQIKYYSQGMIKRLQLSLVELIPWKLLLVDEPFSGLDLIGVDLVKSNFKSWKNDHRTILFVDHNIDRTFELASRVLVLKDQQIIIDNQTKENSVKDDIMGLLN